MMISISNIYGHGFSELEVEKLRSLGFLFRDQVSRFAGSQLLHFIDFPQGPSLEFIEVEDESDYFEFLPKGMIPYCPGISLLISHNALKSVSDFQQAHQVWSPYLVHAMNDESDDLNKPSWSHLNFSVPVVQDTFIYLSKPDAPEPVANVLVDHPNSVKQVVELIFNLGEAGIAKLAHLTGSEIIEGSVEIAGIQARSLNALVGKIKPLEKPFPLVLIVLKTESIDFFLGKEGVKLIDFCSKPAAYIQTTSLSWDLIVTT
ncbi:MAG: hypothetical protein AAGD96_11470 [Chloroflexota bacterium]